MKIIHDNNDAYDIDQVIVKTAIRPKDQRLVKRKPIRSTDRAVVAYGPPNN